EPFAQVEGDEHLRPGPVDSRVRLEAWCMDHGELGAMRGELLRLRSGEEVVREEAVPGRLGDHPRGDAVGRVGSDETVLHEEWPPLQVREQAQPELVETLLRHGLRHVAPPDIRFARRFADDELVAGRAAGVLPRPYDEGTAVGDRRLA